MYICGKNWVGGENACALTPTSVEKINYVEMTNGIYDYLYLEKENEDGTLMTLDECPPTEWDTNTILFAKFDGNTNAGNLDKTLSSTTHLIVKRRTKNDFAWKTLAVREVHALEDFRFSYNDYFVPSGQETEYAIVPVYYGIEGIYSTATVTPTFEKMFLIENEVVYGTLITDGFCDTTRNISSVLAQPLNSRFPTFSRNSMANYDTGTCVGSFFKMEGCEFKVGKREYDYDNVKYQKEVMDFICDGNPKILKMPDGRTWLIQVTSNPSDTANSVYNNRAISFSWVEIGDINSEEDLYYLGLSDVSPEWWNH